MREARPSMKVIVCSGYDLNEEAQSVLDQGAEAFLLKPFKSSSLCPLVRETLDR